MFDPPERGFGARIPFSHSAASALSDGWLFAYLLTCRTVREESFHDPQDQHLRHHVARRRAVAWRIDEHRGEARYCPAVAPDERGRNRGRFPHLVSWRLPLCPGNRSPGGRRCRRSWPHARSGQGHRPCCRGSEDRQASPHTHRTRRFSPASAREAPHHRERVHRACDPLRQVRQEVRGRRRVLRRGRWSCRPEVPRARDPGRRRRRCDRREHPRYDGLPDARRLWRAHQGPLRQRAWHRERDHQRSYPQ